MIKIVVVMLALVALANATDYCNVTSCLSRRLPQTMCTYTSPYPAARCGSDPKSGLSDDEKQRILNLHNELRKKVASGQESRGNPGPQPPATDMATLTRDDELETVAQRWADQCDYNHDKCRDVDRFQVGQNIAMTTGTINSETVEDIVFLWYNEVKDYDKNDVKKFTGLSASNGGVIGHYTQLVWGKTTKLGCGGIRYSDRGWNQFYVVCNYGPSGNYIGEPVYETP